MAKKFDFLSPGINIREIDQSFIPTERDAEGPIIIGRTRKGPANKPVKIRNLDDFVSIFGLPVAGGNGAMGDVWREGNTIGPTYASYAAQSWLASEQSAVTVVRIAGEQHSAVETGGEAGWQVAQNGAGIDSTGHNSTAYGLFIADAVDASQATAIKLEIGAGGAAGTNFDPLYLESSGNVLSFHHKSTAFAGVNHSNATFTLAGGLLFELAFDVDNAKVVGSTTRAGMGGANSDTPKVTIVTHTTSAFEDVLSYIHSALVEELAHAEDAFSGSVSLDYTRNGDSSTLHVYNLSSANNLAIADEPGAGTFCPFQADAQNQAGATTNDIKLQTAGTGLAITAQATQGSTGDGALAAVIYSITGALALVGERLGTSGTTTTEAGALIKSDSGRLGFTLKVFDESGTEKETLGFNFDRNSNNYIRSKLNTNPQLANTEATIVAAEDHKTYWLGETFADHLHNFADAGATTGNAVGILLPLGTGTTVSANWGYQRHGAREAKSGWVFSDRSTNQQKLFRFKSMHVGEEIQKNYLIAIEELAAPANPNVSGYGTFTVCIKDVAGNTVERYTGCSLNPASPNYVAARIGDQYQEWSDTDKRYRTYGDFLNQSNIFYIEMSENVANGGGQGLIPAGFYGPVRPTGFRILAGDDSFKNLDGGDHANPSVQSARSGLLFKGQTANTDVADLSTAERIGFAFPKLRMRDNGSDGGAADQARTYWGVRPKISAASTQHDPDFVDYTRGLGMSLGENGTHVPAAGFEYSFIFSLDDVSGSAGGSVWTWTSGNFGDTVGAHTGDSGASFTSKAGNTFEDLLDENVRQFIMPVWGGSEGFDITEAEPLRNELITDTALSEKTNYVDYSISKALDSVADPEVVPANLLVMPGIWRSSATNKMINIAENRKDILSIIDIQGDYRPRVELNSDASARQGSVTTALTSLKTRNLNSSFACTFYPAVQVSDNLNGGQLVWLPASIAGLGAIARSQATSELWFAPAGFNRGGLGSLGGPRGPRVLQARQRLDSKERDLLYERNINPIATFPAEGVVIFGQKTLQADASALDRINVRRLVLYLKSEVSAVSRNLLFDQNVESTWNRFKAQVNPLLSDTKARFGLTDYKLILDDTTTTADLIDRNIMYAKIFIKPARAIEYIVVDFVITRTGADFV
jgi:hypothetical protein